MNQLVVHNAYGYRRHAKLIHRLCEERGIEMTHYLQNSLLFLKDATTNIFAKNEDGSPRTDHLQGETRLCPSQPEAIACFSRGAREYLGSGAVRPHSRLIVIDADGYLLCRCPACRKLTPVEQWEILFELVQDAAEATGKSLSIHYLSYAWRYRLPTRPRLMERLSGVMFDTHQRLRWRPLGESHDLTHYNELESRGGPAGRDRPAQRLPATAARRLATSGVSGGLCL